jgi:hypothetical protein
MPVWRVCSLARTSIITLKILQTSAQTKAQPKSRLRLANGIIGKLTQAYH